MSGEEIAVAGGNYIESLYEEFQQDPSAVDPEWQSYFQQLPSEGVAIEGGEGASIAEAMLAYRTYGHLQARINPLLEGDPPSVPQLQVAAPKEIIEHLEQVYCGSIGYDYMGMLEPEIERWIQERIESQNGPTFSIEEKRRLLRDLNQTEIFESFLHTRYSGQKRFSLEGGEILIPVMHALIEEGAERGVQECVIGMAHRGRLNVLANILDKSYREIFAEFEEGYIPLSFEGSGDVKYHLGFSAKRVTGSGREVIIELTPNPSHLESVNPVVEGQVRARQVKRGDREGMGQVLPLLIHGDAALSGQGVVYETMQLCKLAGYANGGTIHIVVNNQIGFTTLPKDARSTPYCTDIARAFGAPVFHLNGEDPEACVFAAKMAVELRQRFGCDVFLDIYCHRKYGHNEADEPAFTQPLEYQKIRKRTSVRELYRDSLIQQGVLEREMALAEEEEFREQLKEHQQQIRKEQSAGSAQVFLHSEEGEKRQREQEELFQRLETAVPASLLADLAKRFCTLPEGLTVHRKLQKVLSERIEMAEGKRPVDWAMAEHLAFASLVAEGHHVRLSGQDTRRGTFSQRHAMWVDQKTPDKRYCPLSKLGEGQGRFDVFNSPLSEMASLGFEFGYNLAYKEALVLWEAQFGDFCNGAQVIIDQYLATAEEKWGLQLGLTLLLPHGYEGQGPEHSSARMERFLQLCGDYNMRVVYPTTPAQIFHLLRRQALVERKAPLVIFTPKGLLRLPACVNSIEELAQGSFQEVIDDPTPPKEARRLILCTGRIFYDLDAERKKRKVEDLAILRVEQLYPLHSQRIAELVSHYSAVEEVLWVQEEPGNMGAWKSLRNRLRPLFPPEKEPRYVGRARSASTAAGSYALHVKEHQTIMNAIFGEES